MKGFFRKTIAGVFLSITFNFFFNFVVAGQTTASLINFEKPKAADELKEIHILLGPFEKQDSIEITDSCLMLLRDVPAEMNFALESPLNIVFPSGWKYFVAKGKYKIENPNNFAVEYKLLAPSECSPGK